MAESTPGAVPASPSGGPATRPPILPWLALYTFGRLFLAVALIAIIWVAGLPGIPAMLFGLLLSMPAAYLLLRPVRDRLTEGLAARSIARKQAKQQLRARLTGTDDE